MRPRLGLVLCLSLTLASGACGGDSAPQPPVAEQPPPAETTAQPPAETTAAPTKAQFIAEGDAVCRDFIDATADVRDDTPAGYEQLGEQVAVLREELETAMERFRALTPPPGDEQFVAQYTASTEESLKLFRRLEAAAKQQDVPKVQAYGADLRKVTERQRELAQDYGFKVCGGKS